jgi:starvation-inducible outer membrane lipoprotein
MKKTKNWLLVFLTVTFCFLMLGCQSKEDKMGGTKPSNEAALTKT